MNPLYFELLRRHLSGDRPLLPPQNERPEGLMPQNHWALTRNDTPQQVTHKLLLTPVFDLLRQLGADMPDLTIRQNPSRGQHR